jgi:hypothetical protein
MIKKPVDSVQLRKNVERLLQLNNPSNEINANKIETRTNVNPSDETTPNPNALKAGSVSPKKENTDEKKVPKAIMPKKLILSDGTDKNN